MTLYRTVSPPVLGLGKSIAHGPARLATRAIERIVCEAMNAVKPSQIDISVGGPRACTMAMHTAVPSQISNDANAPARANE